MLPPAFESGLQPLNFPHVDAATSNLRLRDVHAGLHAPPAFKALMFAVIGPNCCCNKVAIPSMVTASVGALAERLSIGAGQVGTFFFLHPACAHAPSALVEAA